MPTDVYLDTSVVAAATLAGSRFHHLAADYCERLAKAGCRVYFSQLLRAELLQAHRESATVPGAVYGSTRRRFALGRWSHDVAVRERWLEAGIAKFDVLVQQFQELYELPLDDRPWRHSAALMARYHLSSYDALHVATAIEFGVLDLATLDSDFTRVDELTVWLLRDQQ